MRLVCSVKSSPLRGGREFLPVLIGAKVHCPCSCVFVVKQSGLQGVSKSLVTRVLIKDMVLKSLVDMGYGFLKRYLEKSIRTPTPVSIRASSNATFPSSSQNSSRSDSPSKENERRASSSSDKETTCSDNTVVGSDSESESDKSGKSSSKSKSDTSFTLVEGKNKRAK
ncbi:hypothetical protein EVAR_46806_1 [Eumeta japonica]|uniref:Uncharacterized protein n=1 Tax=Eumeta variegata TaxID=151549 RepID=A0A4C1XFB6_EUMVA|nr:hypothetical protein EVAR_46806_1 [Eumeta japonica]